MLNNWTWGALHRVESCLIWQLKPIFTFILFNFRSLQNAPSSTASRTHVEFVMQCCNQIVTTPAREQPVHLEMRRADLCRKWMRPGRNAFWIDAQLRWLDKNCVPLAFGLSEKPLCVQERSVDNAMISVQKALSGAISSMRNCVAMSTVVR